MWGADQGKNQNRREKKGQDQYPKKTGKGKKGEGNRREKKRRGPLTKFAPERTFK